MISVVFLKIAIIHHFCGLKRYSFSDYFLFLYIDREIPGQVMQTLRKTEDIQRE